MRRNEPEVQVLEATKGAQLPADSTFIVEMLGPLVTDERKERIEKVLFGRTRSVIPVIERLSDPHNTAAVLRTSDALGAHEVNVIDNEERFVASSRVAKGAERWLDIARYDRAEECAAALHARGHKILVAEMGGEITPADLPSFAKVAIVFGNEHAGVSREMRALADHTYRIPMRGFVESFNVSVAAAISLHAALSQRPGDLDETDKLNLRARFYMQSVERSELIVREGLKRNRVG